MNRKGLLLAGLIFLLAAAGCQNVVAPRGDAGWGGTLGGGNARTPAPGISRDGGAQDTVSKWGGTLGGGS